MKYPLWNCGGPVTQRGPLWQLECELLPIVQGPSKKMGPNRLKNVLIVEIDATPILNNLPLRCKIKEIYNFIEVGFTWSVNMNSELLMLNGNWWNGMT